MVLEDGPMTTPEQEGSYLKGRIGRTCLERQNQSVSTEVFNRKNTKGGSIRKKSTLDQSDYFSQVNKRDGTSFQESCLRKTSVVESGFDTKITTPSPISNAFRTLIWCSLRQSKQVDVLIGGFERPICCDAKRRRHVLGSLSY